MRLTVIIPSRGRPKNLVNTVDSLFATSSSVDVVIRADDDDSCIPQLGSKVKTIIGKRINNLAQAYNECCPKEGLVMLGSDDIIFETNNWDQVVRNAFCGKFKSGVVYGDDGSPGSNLFGTHPIISCDLIEKVGFLAPEGICRHIDSFWRWVGKKTGRYQRIGIVTRHTRFSDKTNQWMEERIESDLLKAREVFNSIENLIRK